MTTTIFENQISDVQLTKSYCRRLVMYDTRSHIMKQTHFK